MSRTIESPVVPQWGVQTEAGTFVAWLVDEGDEIAVGDGIVEVETEKTAGPVEAAIRRHAAPPRGRRGHGGAGGRSARGRRAGGRVGRGHRRVRRAPGWASRCRSRSCGAARMASCRRAGSQGAASARGEFVDGRALAAHRGGGRGARHAGRLPCLPLAALPTTETAPQRVCAAACAFGTSPHRFKRGPS